MACALAVDHEVGVISHVPWVSEWKRRLTGRPIKSIAINQRLRVWHPWYYYPPALLRAYHGWFLWWSIASVARRVITEFKPDVVLAYWLHPDGEAAIRVAREAGIPVVVMSGGSDVLMVARNHRRRQRMIAVLNAADAVVCVSQHLQRAIAAMGTPPQKIHVVYRGVDRKQFRPGDRSEARSRLGLDRDRAVIVWVGRMVPVKGLETLVEACAVLKANGLDFTLYLLGDGPQRNVLIRRSTRRGLSDVIRFVGRVNHDKLGDWYRAANLVVLPSVSEGVPNVLLEAIACGTPFVATDVGGISEIADAKHDRLVPVGSPEALAAALRESLVRSPAGPRRFEPGTWAQSAQRLTDIFNACLQPQTGVTRARPAASVCE